MAQSEILAFRDPPSPFVISLCFLCFLLFKFSLLSSVGFEERAEGGRIFCALLRLSLNRRALGPLAALA